MFSDTGQTLVDNPDFRQLVLKGIDPEFRKEVCVFPFPHFFITQHKETHVKTLSLTFSTPKQQLWIILSGAQDLRGKAPVGYYEELTTRAARDYGALPCAGEIEKDIPRTFPGHARFHGAGAQETVHALRRVLLAYSLRNESVGYCQSMNVLAAWLLLVLGDEEAAFWVLCAVAESACPRYYTPNMIGCQVDLRIFGDLLAAEAPRAAAAFAEHGLSLPVMTARWFLCLFVAVLPSATALRVWDAFFVHGTLVLFRVALAVIRALDARVAAAAGSSEALMALLQDGPRALFDHRALFRTVKHLAGVTYARIDALRAAHSAHVRAEMEALGQDRDLRALLRATHLRRADLDRLERKFGALHGLEPTAAGRPALGFAAFQELLAHALPAWPAEPRLLARLFRVLDQDADGLLSFRELMSGLSVLSAANPEDKLRLLFRIFDTDNDGLLARPDVCALLAQVRATATAGKEPQERQQQQQQQQQQSVEECADRLFANLGLAPATDRLTCEQLLQVIQLDPLVVESLSADLFDAATTTDSAEVGSSSISGSDTSADDSEMSAFARRRVVNRISMMLNCPAKLAPDEFYEAVDIAPSPRVSKQRPVSSSSLVLSPSPPLSPTQSPTPLPRGEEAPGADDSESTSTTSTDSEQGRVRRPVLHAPRGAQSQLRQPLLSPVDVDDDDCDIPPPWCTPPTATRGARPGSGTVVGSLSIAPVADEFADKAGTIGHEEFAPLWWCCCGGSWCCL